MLRLLIFLFASITALHAQNTIKPMWQIVHAKYVGYDAFLSPDGSYIFTKAGSGFSIWDPKAMIHRHNISNRISSIAGHGVSDSLIAIVGRSGEVDFYDTIEVWNYHTNIFLYSFPSHSTALPIFDKSGKYLAVTSNTGIELRDAYSGSLKQTLYQTNEVLGDYLSFNYDASIIMCVDGGGSYWGTVSLWNLNDGSLIEKVNGQSTDSSDFPLKFSEKENILAYHNKKRKSIVFRDVHTKSKVGEIPTEGTIAVIGVPKKNNCITQENDASIVMWDIQTGKSIFSFNGLSSQTSRIRINRDSTLIIATDGNKIIVWDITTGKVIKRISLSKEDKVINCSFYTDTEILVTGHRTFILDCEKDMVKYMFGANNLSFAKISCNESTGEIIIANDAIVEKRKLSTGELIDELKIKVYTTYEAFNNLSFSGEYASKLEYRGDSLYYSFINMKSKKNLSWSIVVPKNKFERFTMNKYSSRIALTSGDSEITIYDTLGAKLHKINYEPFSSLDMFFDDKGDMLFVSNGDVIKVWNVNSGKVIHSFPSSSSGSYNEKLGKLVTKNLEKIDIWDVRTGELLKSIENNKTSYYVLFHPTIDNILIYDAYSQTVDVIDIATEKTLYSIRDTMSFGAFYDPLGLYIYFYQFEKKQSLFDAKSGKLLAYLEGMNGEIIGVPYFSNNGRYVISGVERGDLAVWDLKDLIPTSVENDDTPLTVENNLLTFFHSDNELKISVNEPLHHTQNFAIYNVCGEKIKGGVIPTSSSDCTVHYDTLQSGIYYFECRINGDRYVHQFVVIR